MSETILSVQNLHTSFTTGKGEVHAVNGVSFDLDTGKILGKGKRSAATKKSEHLTVALVNLHSCLARVGIVGRQKLHTECLRQSVLL